TLHDGVADTYQALEVCWSAYEYCLVMDPVIVQVEGFYRDRQRLLAEGWAVEEVSEKATGTCSLNSDASKKSRSIRYGGYWIEYLNVFGMVLVRKDMGGQEVGVSCYVSGDRCLSSGYGNSSASSCFANIGYT